MLQIAIKLVNNIAGPNGLVFTLLVFNAYFWIYFIDPLIHTIISQAIVIKKDIHEIRKINTKRPITSMLNAENCS